jgi:hypothetical protein
VGKFVVEGNEEPFETNGKKIEKVLDIEATRSARYLRIPDLDSNKKLNDNYINRILDDEEIQVKDQKGKITTITPLYPLILTSENELELDKTIFKRTYIFKLEAKFTDKLNPNKPNQFELNEIFEGNIKDNIELLQVGFYWAAKGAQNFIKNGNKIALNKGRVKLKKKKKDSYEDKKSIEDLVDLFILEKCWTLEADEKKKILKELEEENLDDSKIYKELDNGWSLFKEDLRRHRKVSETTEKKYKYKTKTSEFYRRFNKYLRGKGEEKIPKSKVKNIMIELDHTIVTIRGIEYL